MEFDQGDQVAAHLKSKDGKVFSFDLLDSNGGEIRATCFNVIVDRFYVATEVSKVYLIYRSRLNLSQKNYNHLKN